MDRSFIATTIISRLRSAEPGQRQDEGLKLAEAVGVVYSPLADKWRLASDDLDVNYMLRFERD